MLILEDRHRDHVSCGSAGSTQGFLGLDEDVWDILNGVGGYLFLAKDGEMKHDLKRVGIGSDDDEFSDASIECLCGLVGSLLDLLKGCALRDEVEELRG